MNKRSCCFPLPTPHGTIALLLPLGQVMNLSENELTGAWLRTDLNKIKDSLPFNSVFELKKMGIWVARESCRVFYGILTKNHRNMVSLARINILKWLLFASLTAFHFILCSVVTIQQGLLFKMYLKMPSSHCTWALMSDSFPSWEQPFILHPTSSNSSVRLSRLLSVEALPERVSYPKILFICSICIATFSWTYHTL
jgi:hypothetical protein